MNTSRMRFREKARFSAAPFLLQPITGIGSTELPLLRLPWYGAGKEVKLDSGTQIMIRAE